VLPWLGLEHAERTMLSLKPGVSLTGVKPEMVIGALVVSSVYQDHDLDCVITSATDGTHGRNSLHYVGLALDFRTRNVPEEELPNLVNQIREALGDDFDVILHSSHLHCEHQPE
jgi:hypothetical protein